MVRLHALLKKHVLDLAREYVYTADDEHIVTASDGLAHSYQGSAAGAFFVRYRSKVTSAVTDKRKRLLTDAGENKLAYFSVGKRL
jgi:hypothetical protein